MSSDACSEKIESVCDLESLKSDTPGRPAKCWCGYKVGHEWCPNTLCEPPSQTSDLDSLSFTDLESETTSKSSWGVGRFPPSLVAEYHLAESSESPLQESECASCVKLKEEISQLKLENKILKDKLHYLENKKPKKAEYEDVSVFSKLVGGTRRQLSVDELAANVKKLVRHAYSIEPAPADNNIPLLKGKSIQHKFGTDGEDRWYSGTVISQVPGYPAWYNVIYENDIAVYSYRLLQDYEEGNLKILVTE